MYLEKRFNELKLILEKALNFGFFHLLSVNFLNQIMGFGTILIVSKLLSPEELGTVKIIQAYVVVFVMVSSLGLHTSIMKFCSESIGMEIRYYLLKKAVVISILSSTVVFISVVILTINGYLSNSKDVEKWLIIYSSTIAFSVIYNLFIVYLQAIKNFKKMAITQCYIKISSVLMVVTSTFLYGFAGFIISTVIFTILSFIPMAKQVGKEFFYSKRKIIPDKFYFLAGISFFSSLVSIVAKYLDIFILDHFVNDRVEIGYYAMATIFVSAALQVTGTIQAFITPYFSENKSNGKWLKEKLVYYQIRLTLLSMPIAIILYFLVFILVKYYYGIQYEKVLFYTFILLIQYVLKSMYAVIGITQLALVKEHYNAIVALVALFIKIIVSYFLLIEYGVVGIAIAQVLTEIVIVPIAIIVMYYSLRKVHPC